MTPAVASRGRLTVVVAVGALLLTLMVPVPAAGQSPLEPGSVATSGGDSAIRPEAATATVAGSVAQQTNNTTAVQHRDPETVNEDGDLQAVEGHLARQLSSRLEDSAVELNQGEYDRARALLGDDYNESLEQYVEVAGETGNEDAAVALQTATRQQRTFVNQTQEYQTTRERYQEAKRAGDEERARRLARQLERQSQNVTQQATVLNQTYEAVETSTGSNLTATQTTTQNITRTVQQQQAAVRNAEFTETRLRIMTTGSNTSFHDPLTLAGRLETATGTAIANRTITLQVGEDTMRVETNASGHFAASYRPRTIALSATTLTVSYVPADTAPYLGTQTAVPITITRQASATIQFQETPDTLAYNESAVVAGTVTARDQPVREFPIRIAIGNTSLGTVRTDSAGQFRLTPTLPASVPAGDQSLTATHPQVDRAVTANTTQTPLVINRTETTLSTSVDLAEPGVYVVTGRLRTVDGAVLGSQPIAIQTDGTTQTVVTTNATGWYQARIPITAEPGTTVTIEVTFDRSTTNLEAASASARLELPSGKESSTGEAGPWVIIGGIGLLGGVGLIWYVWHRRRRSAAAGSSTQETQRTGSEVTDSPTQSTSVLETAESIVSEDPNTAVRLAYGALQYALLEELSTVDTQSLTHWEFYHACRDAGLIDADGTLRTVTEWYEQAAYSRITLEQTTAEQALETVRDLSTGDSE